MKKENILLESYKYLKLSDYIKDKQLKQYYLDLSKRLFEEYLKDDSTDDSSFLFFLAIAFQNLFHGLLLYLYDNQSIM